MAFSGGAPGNALDVVLLTSKSAGDYMQELVLALREKGIASEVVAGGELDTEIIIDAMRRYRRGALYVLCRDGDLDEEGADGIRKNLLHSRKVDEQHIVSIMLRNKSMVAHARALSTKAKLLGERQPPDATRGPGMGLSKTATLPKVHRKPDDIDDDAKTTVARNPLLDDAKTPPMPKAKPPGGYTPRAPPSPSQGTIQAKKPPKSVPPKMPPMKKPDAPKPMASVPKADPATQFQKPAAPAPAASQPAAAPSPPAPAREFSSQVSPVAAADFDDVDISPGSNKGMLIAVAGVIVALGVGAAFVLGSGDDDSGAEAVVTKVGDKSPEEIVEETQKRLAEEKAIEEAASKEAAAAAAAAKEKADADYAAERQKAAKKGEVASKEAAAEVGGESGDEELALEDDTPSAGASEKEAIAAALANKELRSLDNVLVDPRRSKKGTFPEGQAYCEGREAYGVKGWRMPQIGEVSALVAARMIVKDYYWTQTPGDTSGNRQLMYDSRHGKIKSMSPKFTGARTVCVRPREL